jgi:hypothetical protein
VLPYGASGRDRIGIEPNGWDDGSDETCLPDVKEEFEQEQEQERGGYKEMASAC